MIGLRNRNLRRRRHVLVLVAERLRVQQWDLHQKVLAFATVIDSRASHIILNY